LSSWPAVSLAAPTAQFWEELGGSATGPAGISGSPRGVVPEHRNVSIAIDAEGRPVVAYTDWDNIVVRRWNGTQWEIIGQPGSGHEPHVAIDRDGRIVLAWLQFIPTTQSWEVFLAVREASGTEWQELGGSSSGGGISGAEGPTHSNSLWMALAPDGTPYVAYDTTPAAGADFTTQTSGLAADREQIYVRRWAGPGQGWAFVGSGREGGGASNALSFSFTNPQSGAQDLALHAALSPTIAVGPDGLPVVTFIYSSSSVGSGNPPPFNGLNDDVYVTKWNGSAWLALGDPVPAGPTSAGLGGPGGVSNSAGWSRLPWMNFTNRAVLAVGADGRPVVAWGESGTDDQMRIFVRRWNGATWEGLGGDLPASAAAFAGDVSLVLRGNAPLVTWSHGGVSGLSVYVSSWSGSAWTEVGIGSASGLGVSAPQAHGFIPVIAAGSTGAPTVAWVQALGTEDSGQVYVRAFETRSLPDLTVTALTAPATGRTGQPISVSSTVKNTGSLAAPATQVRFYLTAGTEKAPGDLLLGSRAVGALGVNGVSTVTTSLVIPGGVEPGTWQVLAVVDETNTILERNESNNFRVSAPMTVALFRPDLTISALRVPASAAAGRPLAITHTVRNGGAAAAGPFALRFYLSSDETLDGGDVLLGTRALAGLGAGASSPAVSTFTLPGNTSVPATYRVIVVADALGQQAELDETNNTAVSAPLSLTAYRPDLTITALSVPATAQAGRPLAITHTVRNAGPAPAGAFAVRFYLSSDDTLDGGDVLLGTRARRSRRRRQQPRREHLRVARQHVGAGDVPRDRRGRWAEPAGRTGRDEQPRGLASTAGDRLPARSHDDRAERAGHGPGGPPARHHPHGAQRRPGAGRRLRHPVLPFGGRRPGCGRCVARDPVDRQPRRWRQQRCGEQLHGARQHLGPDHVSRDRSRGCAESAGRAR
jgi:CARDB